MKKFLLLSIVAAGFVSLTACETEERHGPVQTTTTTTEESTVTHPAAATETRTVRTY